MNLNHYVNIQVGTQLTQPSYCVFPFITVYHCVQRRRKSKSNCETQTRTGFDQIAKMDERFHYYFDHTYHFRGHFSIRQKEADGNVFHRL